MNGILNTFVKVAASLTQLPFSWSINWIRQKRMYTYKEFILKTVLNLPFDKHFYLQALFG